MQVCLVRGKDERHQMDETSGKGTGKWSVGKGEHEGKGGFGGQGEQQSTRMTEDKGEEEDDLRNEEEEEEQLDEDKDEEQN